MPFGPGFLCEFELCGPAIDNYRYGLFQVRYPIELYPLRLISENEIISELRTKLSWAKTAFHLAEPDILIENEDRFREALKVIFGALKTRRVISAILAQSQAMTT